ncbi:MAG: adenylosuccinate lyase [Candidatus Peregrinibacteria bacterium]|nr:adenylosuccinate lyase [Candidatus Peregrinibacteria bacterium]
MLSALSPLDGRYGEVVGDLKKYFSEEALIRARLFIEVSYFASLAKEAKIPECPPLNKKQQAQLWRIVDAFNEGEAQRVKEIERTTKHDVKAVEYYLKAKIEKIPGAKKSVEFIHFALTSEDTNNLAYGLIIHQALRHVIVPQLEELLRELLTMAKSWKNVPMLSLTHGQPATPTTVGKELMVFVSRLERQLKELRSFRMQGKFGGAVGNFSAHKAAYPEVRWELFGRTFVSALGLDPLAFTTQINPHDDLAELSHLMSRINTILLGFSRDVWMYISRGVFQQKVVAGEVGSSTMPHKVNPIDFENAEGNLGLSTALFSHFAEKLPVSRLQRDLSDSTVQRNIGVAFGYHLLALRSLSRGLPKLTLDREALQSELAAHPEVSAEAIQTILRKHGVAGAYERLKKLTRGEKVTREQLLEFVETLMIPAEDKERLLGML